MWYLSGEEEMNPLDPKWASHTMKVSVIHL